MVVEAQTEAMYELRGGDEGVINSKFWQEYWGAPEVAPIEYYNKWMLN